MGAPTSRSLQWDEEQLLSAPIAPFHGLDILPEGDWPFPDTQPVKWRLLQDLGAPTLQPEIYEWKPSADARFLTTWDLAGSKMISDTSALSQFYDHSFTVHETSEISTPGVYPGDSMQGSGLWTDSAGTSFATSSEKDGLTPGFPIQGPLTDLRDIPTAAYLTSIVPQTMTVNLIVAVLTVNAPRRVVTRQWRREFDLIEVVVGDDTRSGFGVTFWLPVADHEDKDGDCDGDGDALGKTLASLRPRDIVLMRMVGLGSFRERVYGQSLRKGITKVDLLHRQRVDVTDAGGLYSAKRLREMQQQMQQDPGAKSDDDVPMLKASKVREWIRRWAPDAAGGEGGRGGLARGPAGNSSSGGLHRLPPDTQE
ncbi:hypothetical protein BO70DRAFT_360187 [Aspergillus heteromorphus CBS 117.55]|uniref:Uncharacterized protein n=1 Tax=Aspergillus heteromorphus CBS 117.55 TaxID=1448321 RepID=A0A317WQM1_9EURO|nr:uncharacterized protein BO70DRAFT_360187 [Aspergillus heteromorphus CBS 117.55]PWY87582.1 hypothetical protein BO70DRAFT_360187 [Aspergillus heteromorphus CBS 117.55]